MNAAWGMAQSMNQLKLCLTESHKTVKNMKRTMACTVALGTKDLMTERFIEIQEDIKEIIK